MGNSSYDYSARSMRASKLNYKSVTADNLDTVFTQKKEKKAHESMLAVNMTGFRESRDSEAHPNTVPIQLYLDVTGSMGSIPAHLISEGLPNLIKFLQDHGVNDAALMFGAIGDHECDQVPFQIGQFESGDAELDMWLTRTYPEGNGGGNAGESYALAWFMASRYIKTDAKDKRDQKGFVFTIGDEPVLKNYSLSALKEIFGSNLAQGNTNYTAEELYSEACKDNHVFHIHVNHRVGSVTNLKNIMGQHCIETNDYTKIPEIIANTVNSYIENSSSNNQQNSNSEANSTNNNNETKITL